MLTAEQLKVYAELAVKIGANMQKGQEVFIRSDVISHEFAHLVAEKAYEFGAKRVHIQWMDQALARLNAQKVDIDVLCDIPNYTVEQYKYMVEHKCCLISVISRDPNNFKGCDVQKISKANIALYTAIKFFRAATMSNLLRWTIVAVPSPAWASAVFPNEPVDKAVDKLWNAIGKTMRLDEPNPVEAWENHISKLQKRAEFLNEKNFEYIRFISGHGTDLKVGLAIDHQWIAAGEKGQDGVDFVANMPTEEIFTAPHREKVFGVVKNALPLADKGNVIDDFTLTFDKGKVVDFDAKVGHEALKGLLATDEGVLHIGEIALLGKNSPISNLGILFYDTLFDENASCHLAFGKAYPTTVKNGNSKTPEELLALGVNDSLEHVDFMIGTKDLKVIGIGFDGAETPLFDDGEWVI